MLRAVALSDGLPANRLIEKSSSRTFLAHALIAEHKPEEAIPLYQKALDIRNGVEHRERDADFASEHANLARAYFIVGQLDKADALYQKAVTIFEAATVALVVASLLANVFRPTREDGLVLDNGGDLPPSKLVGERHCCK